MADQVAVWGGFDNPQSSDVRFLQEAARLGPLQVWLASDAALAAGGHTVRFPEAERLYFVESIRWVRGVRLVSWPIGSGPAFDRPGSSHYIWAVREGEDTEERRRHALDAGFGYHVVPDHSLTGFPAAAGRRSTTPTPTVIATGCFDWLHSGHVRFFEEASQFGRLTVVVGHDRNIRLLKGPGHPMQTAAERRYMVASIRFVDQALVSSGEGWLDAAPEIARLRPDVYVVNEDGDHADKRAFCAQQGIRYAVLSRQPKPGLPRRTSTELRASRQPRTPGNGTGA